MESIVHLSITWENKSLKLKSLFLLVLVTLFLLWGCAQQPTATQNVIEPTAVATEAPIEVSTSAPAQAVDLNIFAAASLTEAFGEIGKLFEANHPGLTVVYNFAGSQQLAQQINAGAPADVFASANKKQMDVVIEAGGVVSGIQQPFAENRLVVIYPKDNPAGLAALKDLAKPDLKIVLAAKEVPVGQYSLDFLDKAIADQMLGMTYKDEVFKNVVSYEENVKAVLAKVALGEADAGIVYLSDISGANGDRVSRIDIPDVLNVIASYQIAPVKESLNPELAQAFVDLVLSQQGQAILAKYNFIPVK
jgi:molybdate transport system substrate-binding protein